MSPLTPAAFQTFWRAELARGPLLVEVAGDLDGPALERAVAASFGTLPPRSDIVPSGRQLDVRAVPAPGGRAVLFHKGAADQEAVARIYPTPGGHENMAEQRALTVTAALIGTRLIEEFREKEGGAYSPFASNLSLDELPHYGALLASAQLRTTRRTDFLAALDRITADLATNGPSADAFARAKETQVSSVVRAQTTNGYWLGVLGSALDDPLTLEWIRSEVPAYRAMDIAAVKAVAAKFLSGSGKGSVVEAVPASK